ncbi:hypothetical protein N0M98_19520 [Paenibacillus doosanensis]|nr:hypothetical protein [Paenibacillus doosanensis]
MKNFGLEGPRQIGLNRLDKTGKMRASGMAFQRRRIGPCFYKKNGVLLIDGFKQPISDIAFLLTGA